MPVGWYVIQPPLAGAVDADVHKLEATLQGQVPVLATSSVTLKKIVASLSATQTISGVQASALKKMVATLAGVSVDVYGNQSSALPKLIASLVGTYTLTGAEAAVLKKLVATFAGEQIFLATVQSSLKATVFSGLGVMHPLGSMSSVLSKTTANFSQGDLSVGAVVSVLQKVSSALVGNQPFTSTVNSTLVKLAATFVGEHKYIGTLGATLPKIQASLVGNQPFTAAQISTLAKIQASLVGNQPFTGVEASALAKIVASLSGTQAQSGTINSALAKSAASLGGTSVDPSATGTMGSTLAKMVATLGGYQVPKAATLVDMFETADSAKWAFSPSSAVVSGGRVVFTADLSYTNQIVSQQTYDLTGSSVSVQLVQPATSVMASAETYLSVMSPDANNWVGIAASGPNLIFVRRVAGTFNNTSVAFDAALHKYFRISESGGTINWDTSPDGINWTTGRTGSVALSFNNIYIGLRCGFFTGGDSAINTGIFDNLNVLAPVNISLKKVLASFAGSQAQSGSVASALKKFNATLIGTAPAIQFISSFGEFNTGDTITTMPAHQAGDYLLFYGFHETGSTVPTAPSGYTNITTISSTRSARLVYKIAASGAEAAPVWGSNAEYSIMHVYRGVTGIGGVGSQGGSSATLAWPAIAAMTDSSGKSWVATFGGHAQGNGSLATPPSGMTNRTAVDGVTGDAGSHDTNGGVASWAGGSTAYGGTSNAVALLSVELLG